MKKKISRILGVSVTLSLLASLLVGALPAAALSTPTVTFPDPTDNDVSRANADYIIRFEVDELLGSTVAAGGGDFHLGETGDEFTITGSAVAENGVITVNSGTISVALTGGATYNTGTGAWTTAAVTDTVVVTATVDDTYGDWTNVVGGAVATVTTVSGATITIDFPYGTSVSSGTLAATISAGDGWIAGQAGQTASLGGVAWSVSGDKIIITLGIAAGVGDVIGEGASVRVYVTDGITNPGTPGDKVLTVKTSEEPTPVSSAPYAIESPSIYEPGTVELYNSYSQLVGIYTGDGNIQAAIDDAQSSFTVKVGPGYYDEDIDIDQNVSVVSTGGAESTIISDDNDDLTGGKVIISASQQGGIPSYPGVVLDGFTIKGNLNGGNALSITGEGATVQNCVFTKATEAGIEGTAVAQTMVSYNNAAANSFAATITDCTIDTKLGDVQDKCVSISPGANLLTISNCTFAVDTTSSITSDYSLINYGGGTALKPIISTNNTYDGSSGYGFFMLGGYLKSIDDTLNSLTRAIYLYLGGTVIADGATITGCGYPPIAGILPDGAPAVGVAAGSLIMTGSTVSGSKGYAFWLYGTANWDNVNVVFNSITGNTGGNVYSACPTGSAVHGANFTHNWWGDPDGPAAGSLGYLTGPTNEKIDVRYPLGEEAPGDVEIGKSEYISTTTGAQVKIVIGETVVLGPVAGDPSPAQIIGAAQYAANPVEDTPYPLLADGAYDIFILGPSYGTDIATVSIPNANVDENTLVMVWSDLSGMWGAADEQGVNVLSGKAWFKAGPGLWPEITDMMGTPVALVTAPGVILTAPVQGSLVPATAAQDVAVEQTSFAWGAVEGAVSYDFELAPYLADGADPFISSLIITTKHPTGNGIILVTEVLDYLETYAWRVRAVRTEDDVSGWATSFFTTMAEPEEEEAPTWVIEQEPTQIEWPDELFEINVPAIEQTEIPEYILWVVVAVGAILVIAVIVLIVRTRRVA